MAEYSVSAVCLTPRAFVENLAALASYPVVDLHCDVFPGRPRVPTMTVEQVATCLRLWPYPVTVHVWCDDPSHALRALRPRDGDRVLIQDLSAEPDWTRHIATLTERGWRVGLGVLPGTDYHRLTVHGLTAVQVLTTTTPGRPGGRFQDDAYPYLTQLRKLRNDRCATWSIEADGGVSAAVADLLDPICDLLVLGTNSLVEYPPGGLRLPTMSTKE